MRRRVCSAIGILMALWLFFTAQASASLGPSKVVLDPSANCYQPGESKTLCFLVSNESPDGEAIADIDLGFPGDWTVLNCCRQQEVCPMNAGYVRT
ncbi:MAG: hypothetical protein JRF52_01305 [Deltaproteobacteria bacterium]|nr:hypothetical protein [Deltaproteobacteria bacterium]